MELQMATRDDGVTHNEISSAYQELFPVHCEKLHHILHYYVTQALIS